MSTSMQEFFLSPSKVFIDTERELKVLKDKIKMVLQVKLRQKTTSLVKIFIWTELKTWQRMKKRTP